LIESRDSELGDVIVLDDGKGVGVAGIVFRKTTDVLGVAFTKASYALGTPPIVTIIKEEMLFFEVIKKTLLVKRGGVVIAWKDSIKIFDDFYRQILPILKPGDEMFYGSGSLMDIYSSNKLEKKRGSSSFVAHNVFGWANCYRYDIDLDEIDKPDYKPKVPREIEGVHEIQRNGVVIARRLEKERSQK
jgi:hypothetical protein